MYLDFKPIETETKKFEILRDQYISNGSTQGMFFLVSEGKGKTIKQIFVDKEDINDEYKPKKSNDSEVKIKAYGVEYGNENVLIIEKGLWVKKGTLNKETEVPSKRYRFILTKK